MTTTTRTIPPPSRGDASPLDPTRRVSRATRDTRSGWGAGRAAALPASPRVVYRLPAEADETPAGRMRLLPARRRRALAATIERRARLARATGAALGAGLVIVGVILPLLAIACMIAIAVAGLVAQQ